MHARRTARPRRALVALCTAAATALGGLVVVPGLGFADPQLTLDEVKTQVDDLHHKAEQATERYNAATDRLAEVQRRLDRAQANVKRQEEKVAALTRDMGGFAAANYRSGGIDPTMQVLLADDPDEFLAEASVIDAFAAQQADQLAAVASERQRLQEEKLLADDELDRLRAIEAELEIEKDTIEKLLAEAQRLLDSLEAEERERLERERAERVAAAERERAAAASRSSRDSDRDEAPTPDAPDVPASGKGKIAVDFAMAQLGEPYQYAAEGPNSWDCSGLTMTAWAQAGVSLPRSSSAQAGVGSPVSRSNLQPGDLVFFYSPISHVGIYVGNDKIVHATHPGDVVSVDPISYMPYSGARRPG